MESSTVLAFRIFVMLSCLIIVPMAAIFGSAFPDVVKSVLVDQIVAWSTGKPAESTPPGAETDGFREVSPGPTAIVSRDRSQYPPAPRWQLPQADDARWQAQGRGAAPGASVVPLSGAGPQDGFNQSASFSSSTDTPSVYPSVARVDGAPADSPYHRGALDASRSTAPDAAAHDQAPPAERVACPLEPPERFTEMERKLREYGATYYLLETWGKNSELYRFHCRMAVGNNPNYTRHFEASNRDALKAMAEVLERVEAWRAGRLQ
jgi:hypothetical protein